jgi:hypothetical protein
VEFGIALKTMSRKQVHHQQIALIPEYKITPTCFGFYLQGISVLKGVYNVISLSIVNGEMRNVYYIKELVKFVGDGLVYIVYHLHARCTLLKLQQFMKETG